MGAKLPSKFDVNTLKEQPFEQPKQSQDQAFSQYASKNRPQGSESFIQNFIQQLPQLMYTQGGATTIHSTQHNNPSQNV